MRKLPAEGSSYDKVLVWARLFVERLHSFDLAVESFAGDNHMAAQLAYVHCASLLGVCLHPSEFRTRPILTTSSSEKKTPAPCLTSSASFTAAPWA